MDAADRMPTASEVPTASAASVSVAQPVPSASAPASLAPPVRRTARPSASASGPVRGPDLTRRVPLVSSRAPTATAVAPTAAPSATRRPTGTVIRIGTWSAGVIRGGQDEVDACKDAVQWAGPMIGTEDGYEMRTVVIVGHDYCGFDLFATLRVGTRVTISTPRGTWTYTVYANYVTPGRGAPAAGLYWGDLTLQSCVGPDTGFSYLVRD
ncbi:hypothetical protein [Streptomyces sp. NPDC048277]|uniref:hypothetical protein n=1 Tax=Streptomyces sp. NPDC048277 TaxID=3155027 RepID=UPI0033C1EDF2